MVAASSRREVPIRSPRGRSSLLSRSCALLESDLPPVLIMEGVAARAAPSSMNDHGALLGQPRAHSLDLACAVRMGLGKDRAHYCGHHVLHRDHPGDQFIKCFGRRGLLARPRTETIAS